MNPFFKISSCSNLFRIRISDFEFSNDRPSHPAPPLDLADRLPFAARGWTVPGALLIRCVIGACFRS